VDACCHLAAVASVERGMRDWRGTHRVNLTGTIVLMDAIRARPVPLVYASSAAVYGDCQDLPLAEGAATRPLSAYGADKLGCELHAAVGAHVHGIPATGLRFFNVYGPRQDPRSPYSGVISIFCDRFARGAPVEIFGDGAQTRDFVYVADVVKALMRGIDRRAPGAEVLNVCTGRPTSVLELARAIADLAGVVPDIRFAPPRAGEVRHSLGAPDRARAMLGLPPPTALRDGLADTLAWLARARG
jgi:UDP-glucose 4-epimerase